MIPPFDVKAPWMMKDSTKGYPSLADDAKAMLEWLCGVAERQGMARLIVTEFGRTRDDQEKIYTELELQRLHQTIVGPEVLTMAKALARGRFSWHCIAVPELQCRAFDLRDWTMTAGERRFLVEEARAKYPRAEILDHAVPGGARHLHFGSPAAVRPHDWL